MTVRCRSLLVVFATLALLWPAAVTGRQPPPVTSSTDCDVTEANGLVPPQSPYADPNDWLGSDNQDPSLWLLMARGTGIVERQPIIGAQSVAAIADGYPFSVVFFRGTGSGDISVTAASADGHSIQSDVFTSFPMDVYPAPGMVPASGHLPADGCWTFTATDGNDTLTWTMLVESPHADCQVTSGTDDDGGLPQYVVTGDAHTPEEPRPAEPDHYYGENGLYINLGDPDHLIRRYPADSHLVSASGAITDRFMWFRDDNAASRLTVTVAPGRYWFPDEPEVTVPEHTTITRGLEFSWITFPGPGCWEITGTSGGASITFTVRLEVVPALE